MNVLKLYFVTFCLSFAFLLVWEQRLGLILSNFVTYKHPVLFKGIVHPKIKILLLVTHPYVLPNPQGLC